MTDWTPLSDGDPLPGDPAGIEATARPFREVSEQLADQAGRISAIDPADGWVGLAAQRFADARDRLPGQLRAVAHRCGLAAQTLTRWASEVDGCQQDALGVRARAREAEQDLLDARAGVTAMAAHESWVGPNWPVLQQDAEERLAAAHGQFDGIVDRYRHGADRARAALAEADRVLDDPAWAIGPAAGFLARAIAGPDAYEFVVTDDGLVLNTPEAWRWETYQQAGIDPEAWDPARGLAALDEIAVNAWSFYADLFDRRPDQFLWAGMATLAGGTFYAAFQDLHVLRRGLEDGAIAADEVGDVLDRLYPTLPGEVADRLGDLAARDLEAFAAEVRYVETQFLHMQRQIFDDLAWQHIAYEEGGIDAMEALHERGHIDDVHLGAWRDITAGGRELVERGNRDLLHHEQERIIGDDYDEIRGHSPLSWMMTMGMSAVAHSPVPGGRPFREVVPYEVVVDTPDRFPLVPDWVVPDRIPWTEVDVPGGGGVHIDAPDEIHLLDLPLHNVSIFENRWRWIAQDMLPAWLDHVDDGTAAALVAEPLPDQAARQRLIPDWLLMYEPE